MSDERENKEWIDEYQTLKQVNPANPFVVPASYFVEMEGRAMDNIRLLNLIQGQNGDGFVMPVNYFDDLTQNIESRIAIETVLNTGKGFTIPENYFEDLTSNIESRVAIEEVLNTQSFTIPENYFEGLTQNIESRVAVEELLNTEKGFTVPENYFAGLEDRILQNTIYTAAPVKKNKGVIRKIWANAAFKYATAACFTLFVGAAILMTEFNDSAIHNRTYLHKALSKIPESDIETYLQLNADAPSIMEDADPNSLSTLATDNSIQGKAN
jgi:hypothetical protein